MPSEAACQVPSAKLAAEIAERNLARAPRSVSRFKTGARHYVFDVAFDSGPPVVVRLAEPSGYAEMVGAVHLSRLLRPLGVPLPTLIAEDLEGPFPWIILERLAGTDLGAIARDLSEMQFDEIAAEIARAQSITASIGSAGRYGYAVRPEDAPHTTWSKVLEANLSRSRTRIASAGLFDASLVDIVQGYVEAMRHRLDDIDAIPFLHDTTTKNVIVTPGGDFSGIVDVDDLCFGDPRYPAALTRAALLACGGPTRYVSAWLRHAGEKDDAIFRLYVMLFLLDLMSEHGHAFNGNMRRSTPEDRDALQRAFDASISYMTGS
jgi:aminoglycoside phosphotransferase (APT) family kinase protein